MHAGAQTAKLLEASGAAGAAIPGLPPAALDSDDEQAAAQPAAGRKQKKQKTQHVESAAEAADEEAHEGGDGIALFSGQEERAAAPASPTAAFVDHEPQVHTGDPFEEANVVRKAHRIKASLGVCHWGFGMEAAASAMCALVALQMFCIRNDSATLPPFSPPPLTLHRRRCRAARHRRRCAALLTWRASLVAASGC